MAAGKPAKKRKPSAKAKAPPRPRGRPEVYTPELAKLILDLMSSGTPLAKITRDPDMPAARTVQYWRERDPDFDAAYAQARADGFEQIAMDTLLIADTPLELEDSMVERVETQNTVNGQTVTKVYTKRSIRKSDAYQHRRMQIETRLRLLRAWDPKRYGDLGQRPAPPGEYDGAGTLRVIIEGGLPSAEEMAIDADMTEPAAPGPPLEPEDPAG